MQSTACSSTDVVAATFLDSASQEHVQEILPDRQPENTPEPERLPNIQTEDIGLWLGGDPVVLVEDDLDCIPPIPVAAGSGSVGEPTSHLPIASKRQRVATPTHTAAPKDRIKWVGSIPFVQSGVTGVVHSGRCSMNKLSHANGSISVVCQQSCCIFSGQAHAGLCDCLCHIFAQSYRARNGPH